MWAFFSVPDPNTYIYLFAKLNIYFLPTYSLLPPKLDWLLSRHRVSPPFICCHIIREQQTFQMVFPRDFLNLPFPSRKPGGPALSKTYTHIILSTIFWISCIYIRYCIYQRYIVPFCHSKSRSAYTKTIYRLTNIVQGISDKDELRRRKPRHIELLGHPNVFHKIDILHESTHRRRLASISGKFIFKRRYLLPSTGELDRIIKLIF